MIVEFEELYEKCVRAFGRENVRVNKLRNPDSIEVFTNLAEVNKSPFKTIELSIYRGENPKSFMHIDDFTYEYDADEKKAINEMNMFIDAIAENRLTIQGTTFLGVTFNKKLVIIPS